VHFTAHLTEREVGNNTATTFVTDYNYGDTRNEITVDPRYSASLSLFFPSFVRLIDVFNTLLVFSTLLSLL
jgi:hypothetical protein